MKSPKIPDECLVALSPSPDDFWDGRFDVVPAKDAKVSAFDRSFHFGDSVYEVARTYGNVLFEMEGHMARMEKSAEIAGFAEFPTRPLLTKMIYKTQAEWYRTFGEDPLAPKRDLYIRWMVSRGMSDLNITPEISSRPMAYVFVKPLPTVTKLDQERGLHFYVSERKRNHPRCLEPQMKSGNYMNNILAIQEAKRAGADDALLLSLDGFVTEGTTNNFYMVKDGAVLTSPVELGILEGITRKYIKEVARELGIPFQETRISSDLLWQADEYFMSSTVKEILPVAKLHSTGNSRELKPGPVTKKLSMALHEKIAAWVKDHQK